MKDAYSIVIKPLLTEKGMWSVESNNRYSFKVVKSANKVEIRKAVEAIYGVKVVSVCTQNCNGKTKRVRYQMGKKPDWKKAIVKLEEGSEIDLI